MSENKPDTPDMLIFRLVDKEPREIRAGELCPACHRARLDYDSVLNVTCPACGYMLAGCFT